MYGHSWEQEYSADLTGLSLTISTMRYTRDWEFHISYAGAILYFATMDLWIGLYRSSRLERKGLPL